MYGIMFPSLVGQLLAERTTPVAIFVTICNYIAKDYKSIVWNAARVRHNRSSVQTDKTSLGLMLYVLCIRPSSCFYDCYQLHVAKFEIDTYLLRTISKRLDMCALLNTFRNIKRAQNLTTINWDVKDGMSESIG
jgi:hypothetical protein